ncbi:MAG: isoprenyl transferase [Flavobacteriaceae bacterium]|nr:isoprenyl transferase [Flavobacteriaceae bacterium]
MDKKLQELNKSRLPKHIAVIMDGNGRWAKGKGRPRVFGHQAGVKSVRSTIEACVEWGIPYLTLYAFSTENWNRPKLEVQALMKLLVSSLRKEVATFQENRVRLNVIGNMEKLPTKAQKELKEVMELTKSNEKLVLTLALSYGSREEIVKTFIKLSQKTLNNEVEIEKIDEKIINSHLYTFNLPDVDLMIRTSGEHRISNFMLWQIAYAELYFTDTLWPDFDKECFLNAIIDYQKRERRFGKTSEQINE